jgi:hypothetical protein
MILARFWWGAVFLAPVPVMGLLLIAGPLLLPEHKNAQAGRLDLVSAILSVVSVLPIIYGIFDGTYTQLRDGYFVPAAGYSYVDLYLMGLISAAEVPDFFILKNLVRVANDANGHAIFKAEQTKVTIQDVIAAEGLRSPDVDHSQRKFNTGIVVIVEHGRSPSRELLERANGILQGWVD